MLLRKANLFYTALCAALAIFGYWSFLITLKPMPAPMLEASGTVTEAKANKRKGSIHTIYFSLRDREERFAYPGILPDIEDVWSAIDVGSEAVVLYTDQDPDSEVVDVWGLTVNGLELVRPAAAYRARRNNGYWGLVLGIAFTFCAAKMWLTGGKAAA